MLENLRTLTNKNRVKEAALVALLLLLVVSGITLISLTIQVNKSEKIIEQLEVINDLHEKEIIILKKGVILLSEERDKLEEEKKKLYLQRESLINHLDKTKKELNTIKSKYNKLSGDSVKTILIKRVTEDYKDSLRKKTEDVIVKKLDIVWALQKDDSLQVYKNVENQLIEIIKNRDSIIDNNHLVINNLTEENHLKDKIINEQETIINNKDLQKNELVKKHKKEIKKQKVEKVLIGVGAVALILLL